MSPIVAASNMPVAFMDSIGLLAYFEFGHHLPVAVKLYLAKSRHQRRSNRAAKHTLSMQDQNQELTCPPKFSQPY